MNTLSNSGIDVGALFDTGINSITSMFTTNAPKLIGLVVAGIGITLVVSWLRKGGKALK